MDLEKVEMGKVRRVAPGTRDYHLADARPEYWIEVGYIRQALEILAPVSFLFEPGNGSAMEILMVPMDACINYGAWRGADEDKSEEYLWVSIIFGPSWSKSWLVNADYNYLPIDDQVFGPTAADTIEIACLLNDIFDSWNRTGGKTTAEVSDFSRRQWYGQLYDRVMTEKAKNEA